MRRVGSLVALGLMMALFRSLTATGPLEARATLALGFLLLAAYLGGRIVHRFGLPRLTGYLLVGVCVGPSWLNLVRADEIAALRFISDAAMALIALQAGGELRLELLRENRIALVRLAAGAIVAPFVAVAVVVLTVTPWFPLSAGRSFGDGVVVALILGALAGVSSPMVAMALIGECQARGRFANAILGTTIAQDVAVIVLFSAIVAVARPLTSGGTVRPDVIAPVLGHLVGSVVAGVVLGYVVGEYLRIVQRDTALFLVALAFVVAELSRLLGLEAMLVAAAAGFYVENVSRLEGARLLKALEAGALPIYAVFFGLAGAGLVLGAFDTLWPWVLLVAGLRFWGLKGGLRWAGRHPAVTPELARYGWLSLISQAGVAIGLAGVARRAFPAWGVTLEELVVWTIALNQLVGPITFLHALRRVGELPVRAAAQPETAGVEHAAS